MQVDLNYLVANHMGYPSSKEITEADRYFDYWVGMTRESDVPGAKRMTRDNLRFREGLATLRDWPDAFAQSAVSHQERRCQSV